MTIKDLIEHLQAFDENHDVLLEINAECEHLTVKTGIEDVQFKGGNCILFGETER